MPGVPPKMSAAWSTESDTERVSFNSDTEAGSIDRDVAPYMNKRGSFQDETLNIEEKIMESNKSARAQRRRIVKRLIGVGCVWFIIGGVCLWFRARSMLLYFFGSFFVSHGLFLTMLSVMPTDTQTIRMLVGFAPWLIGIVGLVISRDARTWANREGVLETQCANTTKAESFCVARTAYYGGACLILLCVSLLMATLSRPSWRDGRFSFALPARIAMTTMWRYSLIISTFLSSWLSIQFAAVILLREKDDKTAVNYASAAEIAFWGARAFTFFSLSVYVLMRHRIRVRARTARERSRRQLRERQWMSRSLR
jgi:hypothetical protein